MKSFTLFILFSTFAIHTQVVNKSLIAPDVLNQQVQSLHTLSGRYYLKGAGDAGFDFTDPKTVIWYGDHGVDGLEMRIKWINTTTFILRDKEQDQVNKGCPPRVDVYQVIKNQGNKLILKSIWTGWNDYKDTIEEYVKK